MRKMQYLPLPIHIPFLIARHPRRHTSILRQCQLAMLAMALVGMSGAKPAIAIDYPYQSFAQIFGQPAGNIGDFSFDGTNFAYPTGNVFGGDTDGGINTTVGGSVHQVADPSTTVPPLLNQPLGILGLWSISGQDIYFASTLFGILPDRVFDASTGSIQDLTTGTPSPWDPTATWAGFTALAARNGFIAVAGYDTHHGGVAVGGGGTFQSLITGPGPDLGASLAFDGQHVAFATSQYINFALVKAAIVTDDHGAARTVADFNTPIPGGVGKFTGFDDPAIDHGQVAFVGFGQNSQGIYLDSNGTLTRLFDLNTPVPGGGHFTSFDSGYPVAFDNGHIAFFAGFQTGGGTSTFGLFTDATGTLTRIVATGDGLAEDDFANFSTVPRARLVGNELAFNTVNDIYVVTVPEPSTWLLAAIGAIGLAAFMRHRDHRRASRSCG